MRRLPRVFPIVLAGLLAPMASADVLTMPESAPASTAVGTEVPSRGMTMDKVEEMFGTPREKVPAVGEPPISRWVYSGFTVYFEHQYVLHSVIGDAPAAAP